MQQQENSYGREYEELIMAETPRGELNTGELVETAISVLGNLIGKQKNVLEPVYTPKNRFELSYYRNQVIHLFVNEGMVACSVYARILCYNWPRSPCTSKIDVCGLIGHRFWSNLLHL